MSAPTLRVAAPYPGLLDVNGDRGNLLALRRRCEWRGIGFQLDTVGLDEPLSGRHHLVYLGGGQEADQRRCAADLLATKAEAVHAAVDAGAVVLGVCGGFQLLGRSCRIGEETVPGLGLVDVTTGRDVERLEGGTTVRVDLGDGPRLLAGYENHAGRTTLGPGVEPLGHVVTGPGNDGVDGREGVRRGRVLGTYLRGPVLLVNSWFTDWLLARALDLPELAPLDDTLEDEVHHAARRRAERPT